MCITNQKSWKKWKQFLLIKNANIFIVQVISVYQMNTDLLNNWFFFPVGQCADKKACILCQRIRKQKCLKKSHFFSVYYDLWIFSQFRLHPLSLLVLIQFVNVTEKVNKSRKLHQKELYRYIKDKIVFY